MEYKLAAEVGGIDRGLASAYNILDNHIRTEPTEVAEAFEALQHEPVPKALNPDRRGTAAEAIIAVFLRTNDGSSIGFGPDGDEVWAHVFANENHQKLRTQVSEAQAHREENPDDAECLATLRHAKWQRTLCTLGTYATLKAKSLE